MVICNHKRRAKQRIGYCEYPGCGAEYITTHNGTKYCDAHRTQADRPLVWKEQQARARAERDANLHIAKPGNEARRVVAKCGLAGCSRTYAYTVLPRLHVYPKYCPEHRTEYRRMLYAKRENPQ